MTITPVSPAAFASDIFDAWLESFGDALESGDARAIAEHFEVDGYWRDILAFTWSYRTFSGRDAIQEGFTRRLPEGAPRNVRRSPSRMAPRQVRRSARDVVEGYFDFDVSAGTATGFVRLALHGSAAPKIWIGLTALQELADFPETVGDNRPSGVQWSYNFAGDNWLDERIKAVAHVDTDPDVLVVGAGQAGLALAARLTAIGVDTLVVEANARVGDNWRNRYHSLTLHNEVWANSLPYMPFPDTWPTFVPKDKLAGWLEYYAEAMELNVWTGTRLVGASWDEDAQRWTVRLRRSDGSERGLIVAHLVLATGAVSSLPLMPALPGLDTFQGQVMHSTDFSSGTRFTGKKAIVVGTGNSGHDVAQDLCENGAEVHIVQRGSTCVVSLVPSGTMVYSVYSEGPAEDIDLITAAIPYPVLKDAYQWLTKKTRELDKDLVDRLAAVGFKVDMGEDETGFHMKYLREGGGYYINVGCSDLIADGAIGLVQNDDIETYTQAGMLLNDGTVIEADLIVLATGYETQQAGIARILGEDVAAKVGPVWGHDDEGFMNGTWRPLAQPGLWLMGGALMECRLWSRFLALQIKADLEGVLPSQLR
ncbi:MAG: NAD(P)/FAD-dependent oxidoreductase [Nocardioides sp.]|uniref:flavin-containing monooxygenase n=1 Tax=Nocardioides sp. TaxID=35761 RepID=UPI0039E5B1D1